MPTNDEWRVAIDRPDLTDAEVDEFRASVRASVRAFFGQFLDWYLRDGLAHDD